MQRYYDELAAFEREGFDVIVDKTYEDLNPRDCFDTDDIEGIIKDIDRGHLEWFMMRIRVMAEGVELGSSYLGGMLYEDPSECLTDGTMEDMLHEAIKEAKSNVYRVYKRFAVLNEMVDAEGVVAQ
jgi:hypothetical protein